VSSRSVSSNGLGGQPATIDEFQRRQSDWDRQMVNLDQKQTEVVDMQWKLIREQTGALARELSNLRGDMATLKKECLSTTDNHVQLQGQHSTLFQRVEYLEQFIGESSDKGAKAIEDAHAKLNDAHGEIFNQRKAHEEHVATMEQRLAFIERQMGDSADLTMLRQEMDKDKKHRDRILDAHSELKDHHASLRERIDYLEQFIGESADKHAKMLEDAHNKLKDHASNMQKLADSAGGHKATMEERLEAIEAQFRGTLNEHKDMLQKSIDGHKSSIDARHSAHGGKMDELHGKLSKLDSAHNGYRQQVDDKLDAYNSKLKDHQSRMEEVLDSHMGMQATVEDRMQAAEALVKGKLKEHADQLQKTIDGHRSTIDGRHSTHGEKLDDLHSMVSKIDAVHSGHKQKVDERLDAYNAKFKEHQNQMQEFYNSHMGVKATMEDRMESVESFIKGITDKHSGLLEDLNSKIKDAHGVIKGEKAAREQHHATYEQRLMFLEKQMGDSADNHLKQIEDLERKHKTLSNKMDDVHGTVKGEKEARTQHHASMNERVEFLEKFVGDSADKHEAAAKMLEGYQNKLKDVHGHLSKQQAELLARQQHHATMEERMEFLEKQIGDSADNHKKAFDELESLKGKHKKMVQDHEALHGHVKGEKDARDQHHATVQERLEFLEQFVGDSADKHQKAMKDLEGAQSKLKDFHGHMNVFKAAHEEHKATIEERLEFVEKMIGDTADKHAEALEALKGNHSKLNKTLDQLHGHIKGEKDNREKHHATMEERVVFLETAVGDSADKHEKLSKLLDSAHTSLKDIHGKHNGEKASREQHHASLQERLDFIEKRIGDSADQHNNHINDLSDVKERIKLERNARDTHAAAIKDQLDRHEKARLAHHDSVKEVLASERNAREAAHQSLQDMVHKEKNAREKHHATYSEFLDREKASREQHRNSIEDLLSREKAERLKHHETVGGRVDSLERTVGIFDEIARKEQAERKAEFRRVWDAIDSHTHDLSTSISKDDGPETPVIRDRETRYATPTILRSVTPARVTPIRTTVVERIQAQPAPITYTSPPVTSTIVSAPTSIIPASTVPVVKTIPAAYETREVVREVVRERSPEPRHHHHSTETITCGHTRYGGQAHSSAQVPLS